MNVYWDYNNTNREECTHGDRPDLFLRRISKETDRGLLHIGWQVNPCLFRYGAKSLPYNDLGACIDYNAQVLLVQKILSELARDPDTGEFKDLQQRKDDQQGQPMQKPELAGGGGWFSGGGGTNP